MQKHYIPERKSRIFRDLYGNDIMIHYGTVKTGDDAMTLQQLEYFLVSAQKASLTKAAEELYTSQPHVSQVIRSLELELGAKLFDRTGSGISLTAEGESIRFYAENILRNTSLIRETCEQSAGNTLRIAANASSRLAFFGGDYFVKHIPEELTLQYTECGAEKIPELLQNRLYDLGFLFVPVGKMSVFHHMLHRRQLRFTPLLESDLVVHCGPQSPFYGRKCVSPEELDQGHFIQMEDDYYSPEDLLMAHAAFRSGKCRIRKMIRTNSDHLMIRMLKETHLSNIGSYWIKNRYETHGFSISVIDGFQKQVLFGCLEPAGRPRRREAEEFLEQLKRSAFRHKKREMP